MDDIMFRRGPVPEIMAVGVIMDDAPASPNMPPSNSVVEKEPIEKQPAAEAKAAPKARSQFREVIKFDLINR